MCEMNMELKANYENTEKLHALLKDKILNLEIENVSQVSLSLQYRI